MSDVTIGFDLRVPTEGWKGKQTQIIKLYEASGPRVLTLERANGTWLLSVIDRGKVETQTEAVVPLDTWTNLALHLQVGAGSDRMTLTQDGVDVLDTTMDLGYWGISRFLLGTDNRRVALDLVFDNVELTI